MKQINKQTLPILNARDYKKIIKWILRITQVVESFILLIIYVCVSVEYAL